MRGRPPAAGRMPLSRALVRARGWIALAWVVLAGLLVPQASRIAQVLDTGAHLRGTESGEVEQLLAGPLASKYAHYGVLVVTGVPSPEKPHGAEALRRIVEPLRDAAAVSGVFSYLDFPDSMFTSPRGRGTMVLVGFDAAAGSPDKLLPGLRQLTEGLEDSLRAEFPAAKLHWTGETALNVDLCAMKLRK